VDEFFDSNPMSQLGWIITRNKMAEKVAEMSGNVRTHLELIKTLKDKYTCDGEPSFQNALEMALSTLKHMPSHTSREILIIHASLTTCDPSDITVTIEVCVRLNNCLRRCLTLSCKLFQPISSLKFTIISGT